MVVDEPHRLHERVGGGRPDEAEAAALQVLRQRLGRRRDRHRAQHRLGQLARPLGGLRLEAPHVACEGAFLFDECAGTAGIADRRFDLAAMSHDAGIAEQALDVALPEARHLLEVELRERRAERVALPQDREPRQPRLEALETELFEEPAIVGDRKAPLVVVVVDVEPGGAVDPEAAAFGAVVHVGRAVAGC